MYKVIYWGILEWRVSWIMYHVDIILLWILQRCKMEYNCIYQHSIKGAWFIKTHKSSIILIMGLIKIRDIKNISAVLRCSPISCPDKDSLLIRDEVLLQKNMLLFPRPAPDPPPPQCRPRPSAAPAPAVVISVGWHQVASAGWHLWQDDMMTLLPGHNNCSPPLTRYLHR